MRTCTILCVIFFNIGISWSQEKDLRELIDKMFQSMYTGDTVSLRSCFTPGAQLWTYAEDDNGNKKVSAESLEDFVKIVSGVKGITLEERILSWEFLVDKGIATIWTPYEFYVNEKFSHCGTNSFQLILLEMEWKISQITDTRMKVCNQTGNDIAAIDSMINRWHHAAAVADEETFFNMMTEDGIYIGTDPGERWLRDELKEWSKKYFDRESAWDFTPISRSVKIGSGGTIAWFDELLDTWMGVCRSTGILRKENNEWKLKYYHLSVSLPNDKIEGYKELIGKK